MAYALVFSGQGGQHAGMLPWLAEDALVRSVQARLGVADWRAALATPGWAERNAPAQCLLTGLALAAWAQLAPHLPPPAAIAGYSVGELAAFSAAGVFDAGTALDLAQARAAEMDRCAAGAPGGLLGLSQIAPAVLDRLLAAEAGVALAIRNAIDSVVLGGPHPALERVEAAAVAEGAHATRLRVAVPSHTPGMRPAAQAFAAVLAGVPLARPRTPLFSNAADRVADAAQAASALAAQIATTVRWDECMENLHARGVDCVLEIGAGQALARMWNQRFAAVPARAVDEFRSMRAVVQWVERAAAAG
ncbi:acyltransferase domain-containing protein [Pseudorhodoferax sp. Leaf274]|uniref:acyltransferase domain-containing protein n=1 Tax=Pseudorhodoferax sp. Leaf274 TaxID=1736318 RepID=UPI000702C178|nr:acyltransferase domain-containing protein [Pseudorhodoferax sp. Leaf274]KQP49608.1 ACP S-malonyltransferase [Pseudorhodoferax sp. Leaf274]